MRLGCSGSFSQLQLSRRSAAAEPQFGFGASETIGFGNRSGIPKTVAKTYCFGIPKTVPENKSIGNGFWRAKTYCF
jgi:hypothetical protein